MPTGNDAVAEHDASRVSSDLRKNNMTADEISPAIRGRNRRPDKQLYVPKARRLSSSNEKEKCVGNDALPPLNGPRKVLSNMQHKQTEESAGISPHSMKDKNDRSNANSRLSLQNDVKGQSKERPSKPASLSNCVKSKPASAADHSEGKKSTRNDHNAVQRSPAGSGPVTGSASADTSGSRRKRTDKATKNNQVLPSVQTPSSRSHNTTGKTKPTRDCTIVSNCDESDIPVATADSEISALCTPVMINPLDVLLKKSSGSKQSETFDESQSNHSNDQQLSSKGTQNVGFVSIPDSLDNPMHGDCISSKDNDNNQSGQKACYRKEEESFREMVGISIERDCNVSRAETTLADAAAKIPLESFGEKDTVNHGAQECYDELKENNMEHSEDKCFRAENESSAKDDLLIEVSAKDYMPEEISSKDDIPDENSAKDDMPDEVLAKDDAHVEISARDDMPDDVSVNRDKHDDVSVNKDKHDDISPKLSAEMHLVNGAVSKEEIQLLKTVETRSEAEAHDGVVENVLVNVSGPTSDETAPEVEATEPVTAVNATGPDVSTLDGAGEEATAVDGATSSSLGENDPEVEVVKDRDLPSQTIAQADNWPSDVVKDATCSSDDEGSWDALYDDSGECLDPSVVEQMAAAVGKVSIDVPQIDYLSFQTKEPQISDDELGYVLEIYNFPAEFTAKDLGSACSYFRNTDYEIHWVNDTHALAVFASRMAAEAALAVELPIIKTRPLSQASKESKIKAKTKPLHPFKLRPATTVFPAVRSVLGALGLKVQASKEQREEHRKKLQEARELKQLASKQRKDAWEGNVGND